MHNKSGFHLYYYFLFERLFPICIVQGLTLTSSCLVLCKWETQKKIEDGENLIKSEFEMKSLDFLLLSYILW